MIKFHTVSDKLTWICKVLKKKLSEWNWKYKSNFVQLGMWRKCQHFSYQKDWSFMTNKTCSSDKWFSLFCPPNNPPKKISGIIVRTRDNPTSAEVATYAPFMLFPSPLPRLVFEQAQAVQKDFNLMMHRVAHDYDFLKDCLARFVSSSVTSSNDLLNLFLPRCGT